MDEYTKHQLQIPYSKNPSYTPTIHPPSFYYQQSLLPSYLIPVRIDLEYDNVKLSDCFIWNYNEVLITPEDFALQMQKEMDLPKVFIEMIAGSIREQVLLYRNAVEDDTVDTFDNMVLGVYGDKDQEMEDTNQDRENKDQGEKEPNSSEAQQEDKQEEAEDKQENNTEEDTNDKPDENDDQTNVNEPEEKYEIKKQSEPKHGFGDIRIVIKLDIHVGSLYLKDQFEWPLFHQTISPEQFAIQLATELGIGGEFIPLISVNIREQVIFARLNFNAQNQPLEYSRNLRDEEDWEPELILLDDEEIMQMEKDQERSSR